MVVQTGTVVVDELYRPSHKCVHLIIGNVFFRMCLENVHCNMSVTKGTIRAEDEIRFNTVACTLADQFPLCIIEGHTLYGV